MTISPKQAEKFRAAILNCDAAYCSAFLAKAETFTFGNVKSLLGFHDDLLLLEAYPCSRELHERANNLLRHFGVLTRRFLKKNRKGSEKLINSGLFGSEAQGSFTFPLLQLLADHSEDSIYLHSFDEEGKSLSDVLKHFLPSTEFEVLEAGYTNDELLEELFGNRNHMVSVVRAMSYSKLPDSVRDALFDEVRIYAGIKYNGHIPDRSNARGIVNEVFVHNDILKRVDPMEVVNRPLPKPVSLSKAQQKKIQLDCAAMLASLNRETDPVSLCAENGITLFELERGVSVALFSMKPERRLPLDSYIGYVLMKNGVPHAYGGSWLFGNRALFGINIFEPFRGGESSLTILQLLRVYRQHYNISAFSVEPYQYGKDNPEGIQSGAYWFYYKMGFRSDDKKLAALAEKEMGKMKKNKSYRSTSSTLKKFTESNITWKIDDVRLNPSPSQVSKSTTTFIRRNYGGDREQGIQDLISFHGLKRGDIADEYVLSFLQEKNSATSAYKVAAVKDISDAKRSDERLFNALLASLYSDNQ